MNAQWVFLCRDITNEGGKSYKTSLSCNAHQFSILNMKQYPGDKESVQTPDAWSGQQVWDCLNYLVD